MRYSRAALLRGLACSLSSLLPPRQAAAWCGDPFPPYAYSLPWFEFQTTSKLPLRVVGDRRQEVERQLRPLLVVPSVGFGYEYLENLEALTISQRRVAFADLSGAAGASSLDTLAAQVVEALAALEAPFGVHVLGHGLGAAVALRACSAASSVGGNGGGARVASLILVSPLGSVDDAEPAARDELARSPSPLLRAASKKACVDAELGRLRATPGGPPLLLAGDARVGALLEATQPGVPILVARGTPDVSAEATAVALERAVPRGLLSRREFGGGPLPAVDDRAAFAEAVVAFMDGVDGTVSRRAIMAPGSMMPAGSLQ